MRILVARLLSALMLGGASLPALLPEEPPSGGSSLLATPGRGSAATSESLAERAPASAPDEESPSSSESTPASSPESSTPPQSSSTPSSKPAESTSTSSSEAPVSSALPEVPMAGSMPEESAALAAEEEDTENGPVILSEEYANLLATTQADSMMGFYGLTRSEACPRVAAVFPLAEYAAKTEDEAYTLLWDAMNAAFETLAASGAEKAHCVFEEGDITILKA